MEFSKKKNILRISRHAQSTQPDQDEIDDYKDANIAKGTAMAVLFLASFILGTIPIQLNKWFNWSSDAKHSVYVRLLLGLAGGVLLCTTFIHLLPEVKSNFDTLYVNSYVRKRFAEILLCVGFFIMYFIEECVHTYLHYKEKHMPVLRRGLRIRRGEPLDKLLELDDQPGENPHSLPGHSHAPQFDSNNTTAIIRGLLVVLALSIHELFEGLAVGLEPSSHIVWYIFGAVSAHKLVIAFCIGIELVTSNLKTYLIIIYIFIFAVVTPLGIGIGILIISLKKTTALVSLILQGIAAGTLVYVVFFEILQGDQRRGMIQYFAILTGFSIMFCITLLDIGS